MAAAEAPAKIRWLDVDAAVRKRVARAVRRGRPVDDPRDAALAVGYAEASLDWLSHRGRLRPFHLVLALVVVVELIATWRWSLAGLLYPVLGFGFLRFRAPVVRRRLAAARDANAGVAAEWRLPPVQVRLPGYAWLYPGTRRRRRLVVSLGVVLTVLVGLTATGMVGAIVHKRHWAAAADRVCAQERARLVRLRAQGLGARETLRRTIPIERGALVALGQIAHEGDRTPLESNFIAWRRYELELDAWLLAATNGLRIPAERAHRAEARERAQALARRLGAGTCAHV